ncbi:hypothetical protein [Cryobacterium sp. Y82]|uniref:hypothetical protein n=1 Tax=Cryobacterium sp. Y82 TaxID=2045017 RepID=UPI000CE2E04A|nr:hypothetical protein [Cryobacterium sp. Y82]
MVRFACLGRCGHHHSHSDVLGVSENDVDTCAELREGGDRNGTLYLLATSAGSNNSAALVSAFVDDLVETA